MSRGMAHEVLVVYATSASFSTGALMRISKRFSPFAGTKRNRGRSQLDGKSAPGREPLASPGSTTHGPLVASKFPAGPNSDGAFDGTGVDPAMSNTGLDGKSVQPLVHAGTTTPVSVELTPVTGSKPNSPPAPLKRELPPPEPGEGPDASVAQAAATAQAIDTAKSRDKPRERSASWVRGSVCCMCSSSRRAPRSRLKQERDPRQSTSIKEAGRRSA